MGSKSFLTLHHAGPWVLPIVLLAFSFILIMLALGISANRLENQLTVGLFAVGALGLMHAVYLACAELTTDKTLKGTDYIYLGLALYGLFAVADIDIGLSWSSVRTQVSDIVTHARADAKCFLPYDIDRQVCTDLKNKVLSELVLEHAYRFRFGEWKGSSKDFPEELRRIFGPLVIVHGWMAESLEELQTRALRDRLLGIYVLLLALSIRLSRVTAELCEWHLPKQAK